MKLSTTFTNYNKYLIIEAENEGDRLQILNIEMNCAKNGVHPKLWKHNGNQGLTFILSDEKNL